MRREFHVEQNDDDRWEVRDRADVWVAEFDSKVEAQRHAAKANHATGF